MWVFSKSLICTCMYVCQCVCVDMYESLILPRSLVDFDSWEYDLYLYHHQIIFNWLDLPDIFRSGHWAKGRHHLLCGKIETHNADLHFCQIIGAHSSVWGGRSFTELTENCSCKAKDPIWLWLPCPVLLTCKGLAKIMACQVQFSYRPLTP